MFKSLAQTFALLLPPTDTAPRLATYYRRWACHNGCILGRGNGHYIEVVLAHIEAEVVEASCAEIERLAYTEVVD